MPVTRAATPPTRTIAGFGLLLAVVLALALGLMLWNDWHNRVAAAQRQSLALVTGTDRLLRSELNTLERALTGIASDGRRLFDRVPAQAPQLLDEAIKGVLSRNAGLESVVLVDAAGRPLAGGEGDATLPQWAIAQNRGVGGRLYVGRLERRADGHRVLRLALPMQPGRWLLARLHVTQLQDVVGNLDTGRRGVVAIASRQGEMLAHSLEPAVRVGQGFLPPDSGGVAAALQARIAADDGVRRISATVAPREYPLVLYAGLARDEVLARWWPLLYAALGIYLLYWLGFLYLLSSVRRSATQQERLGEELRAGSAELALAHRVGKVGTWSMDDDGSGLRWSALSQRMFALPRRQAGMDEFFERVHRDDRAALRTMLADAWAGKGAMNAMFRLVLPGGELRWLSVRGELVETAGPRRRMAGAVVDVSERVHDAARVQAAEHQFRLVFERNPAPFWVFDMQTLRFLEVNQAAVRQYGYSREEFLAMSILDIRPQEDWGEIHEAVALAAAGEVRDGVVRVHRRKDGSLFEVRGHVSLLEFGGVRACLVLAEDVSERIAYERELAYRASHHLDTGLLNVRALAEMLDSRHEGYTIAHVQLRGLQMVGDTLGREAGEQVLRAVAARLGGLGARYGLLAFQPAEDFVLAICNGHDPHKALDALLEIVAEPVRGHDSCHQLEARIGVACCPQQGELAEQVIGRAAQAAYAAREERTTISWFDDEVAARLSERLQLAGRIHSAIDREEFELHFQPIRHAADGSIAALEALLRWPQADGSFVPPGHFIQLCEDTGLIIALGRWVIRAAARAQRQLVQSGWGHLPIAVNVSAVQFFNSDLVGEFARAAEEFGLQRGALQLELTESSLMHKPAQALQTMQRLHEKGVCVSLDDFGTGFSSMSYLQHLPLDSLKIDRCFVSDVERNPRNAAICRALLSLGHSMGLTVIAEGVETEGQYSWLAAHGCDQVQGYLLGRPLPLRQVVESFGPATA